VIGCLTAPFKLIGCLGLLAALAFGWLYRDRLLREGRRLVGGGAAVTAESTGRPGIRALKTARAKIDSLSGWRADSVVLTPSEVASLVGSGLDPALRRQLDSLRVRLLDDEIALLARLRTARLPREAVGPLAVALRETEPIEAAGMLRVVEPGLGEWKVRSFRIRDFPVPADLVPGLIARALDRKRQEAVPVKIPAGIAEIRVRPDGATLYGVPRE
jgi:hypothetical protein